jgi:pilus assembly protein Flp/PilA
MFTLLSRFSRDESGASLVEYGLLLALISLIAAGAAVVLGTQLSIVFSKAGDYMTNAATGVPTSPYARRAGLD